MNARRLNGRLALFTSSLELTPPGCVSSCNDQHVSGDRAQQMKCREFKSNHVGFIDDLLPAADMSEMRRHLAACDTCAALDTRIRRSLLVVRNLPQIEPSADFFARLSEALKDAPPPEPRIRPFAAAAALTVVTAALAAAVYFVMAFGPTSHQTAKSTATAAAPAPIAPLPMNEVVIAATVPAGVPVWPAMFMVGELPTHLTNAEILDTHPAGGGAKGSQ
jgi:hypothetical protein